MTTRATFRLTSRKPDSRGTLERDCTMAEVNARYPISEWVRVIKWGNGKEV